MGFFVFGDKARICSLVSCDFSFIVCYLRHYAAKIVSLGLQKGLGFGFCKRRLVWVVLRLLELYAWWDWV